ncbi:hypothetical protein DIPPA_11039 [Diplonema papillatum]|nr:hypothetical protein DIPPA_11039 [Diplonema papillatum]
MADPWSEKVATDAANGVLPECTTWPKGGKKGREVTAKGSREANRARSGKGAKAGKAVPRDAPTKSALQRSPQDDTAVEAHPWAHTATEEPAADSEAHPWAHAGTEKPAAGVAQKAPPPASSSETQKTTTTPTQKLYIPNPEGRLYVELPGSKTEVAEALRLPTLEWYRMEILPSILLHRMLYQFPVLHNGSVYRVVAGPRLSGATRTYDIMGNDGVLKRIPESEITTWPHKPTYVKISGDEGEELDRSFVEAVVRPYLERRGAAPVYRFERVKPHWTAHFDVLHTPLTASTLLALSGKFETPPLLRLPNATPVPPELWSSLHAARLCSHRITLPSSDHQYIPLDNGADVQSILQSLPYPCSGAHQGDLILRPLQCDNEAFQSGVVPTTKFLPYPPVDGCVVVLPRGVNVSLARNKEGWALRNEPPKNWGKLCHYFCNAEMSDDVRCSSGDGCRRDHLLADGPTVRRACHAVSRAVFGPGPPPASADAMRTAKRAALPGLLRRATDVKRSPAFRAFSSRGELPGFLARETRVLCGYLWGEAGGPVDLKDVREFSRELDRIEAGAPVFAHRRAITSFLAHLSGALLIRGGCLGTAAQVVQYAMETLGRDCVVCSSPSAESAGVLRERVASEMGHTRADGVVTAAEHCSRLAAEPTDKVRVEIVDAAHAHAADSRLLRLLRGWLSAGGGGEEQRKAVLLSAAPDAADHLAQGLSADPDPNPPAAAGGERQPEGSEAACVADELHPVYAGALRYEGKGLGSCEAEMGRRFGAAPVFEAAAKKPGRPLARTTVTWRLPSGPAAEAHRELWTADRRAVDLYLRDHRQVLYTSHDSRAPRNVSFRVDCSADCDLRGVLCGLRARRGVCCVSIGWHREKKGVFGKLSSVPRARVFFTNLPDAQSFEKDVRASRAAGVLGASIAPLPTLKPTCEGCPGAKPAASGGSVLADSGQRTHATVSGSGQKKALINQVTGNGGGNGNGLVCDGKQMETGTCFVCHVVPTGQGDGIDLLCGDTVCNICAGLWLSELAEEQREVRCGGCNECLGVLEIEDVAKRVSPDGSLKHALEQAAVRRCVADGMARKCPTDGCREILPNHLRKEGESNVCAECTARACPV